jgi:hypothetical protein
MDCVALHILNTQDYYQGTTRTVGMRGQDRHTGMSEVGMRQEAPTASPKPLLQLPIQKAGAPCKSRPANFPKAPGSGSSQGSMVAQKALFCSLLERVCEAYLLIMTVLFLKLKGSG